MSAPLVRRLIPYGRVTLGGYSRAHLTAYALGVRDGWAQPFDLRTSTNVEHLGDVQESLDAGINLGQWLRSPLYHQRQPSMYPMREDFEQAWGEGDLPLLWALVRCWLVGHDMPIQVCRRCKVFIP